MQLPRAVLVDTETTGIDEPHVIQLAFSKPFTWCEEVTAGDYTVKTFKPGRPITSGAKATHHIIEADLVDAPLWPGSYYLDAEYLIGHNIDYDWKALGEQPNVKRICTLALSRFLYEDADSHSLTAMMYELFEDQEARAMAKHAHEASGDLQMTWLLLKELISDLNSERSEDGVISALPSFEDLWRVSEQARMPLRMTFGKYGAGSPWAKQNNLGKGMLCAEVRTRDRSYWDWLMSKCDQVTEDPYLQKALRGERA